LLENGSVSNSSSSLNVTDGLQWFDFNVGFHGISPDNNTPEIKKVVEKNGDQVIDIRPFMIPRPFTAHENDSIQKCLDLFRLMNLRNLPVLNEDDGSLIGMITRQDLFAFMSV